MYTILFLGMFIFYLVSAVSFVIFALKKRLFLSAIALFCALAGFITHTIMLIVRVFLSGFFPASNLYESILLFSWAIALIFLIIEYRFSLHLMGAFVMPIIFILTGYASMLDSSIRPLAPALQSSWLFIHVMACFISYACFTCAFCLGIMYLLQERQVKCKHTGKILERFPSLKAMDKINYNMIFFGFVLLTAGIITGSIWAQQAWGVWWSWDPKETSSLVTWLIYAVYLHARFNSGWQGRKTAILSIIGFMAVLFTYLGVSFLLPGLHSYF